MNWSIYEEYPWRSASKNTEVPSIDEEYNTKLSQEYEGRITKDIAHNFRWTGNRIALSKLDDTVLNSKILEQSVNVFAT